MFNELLDPELPDAAEPLPAEAGKNSEPNAAVEAAPAQATAEAPQAADSAAPDGDETPLPEALSELLQEHPELENLLQEKPGLKSSLRDHLRANEELGAFQKLFSSLDDAKFAQEQAQALGDFDRLYFSEHPEAPMQLLERLRDNQFLKDPATGEPVLDEQGTPVSTGAYDRLTAAYRNVLLQALETRAAQESDERLREALQVIQERLDGKAAPAASATAAAQPPTPESVPPELTAKLRRLEEYERRAAGERQQKVQNYYQEVAQAVEQNVRADIDSFLARTDLPRYVRQKLSDDIFSALNQNASNDSGYQTRIQALLRNAGLNEPGRERVVAAARGYAKQRLGAVGQHYLRQAVQDLQQEQNARAQRESEQRKRVEVKAGGAVPAPVRRSDSERIRGMEHKLGRKLTDREILDL